MSGSFGNSPRGQLIIRAEARKSLSFALWIKDERGRSLDITNTSITLVVKKFPFESQDDSTNLIVNSEAALVAPVNGYAQFSLQGSDLDHKPGEYYYALVLLDNGYSSVLAKGTFEIVPNTEFASASETYDPVTPASTVQVTLRSRNSVDVRTGPTLAPGTTSFSLADKDKLDSIEPGAQVHIASDWGAGDGDDGYIMNKPDLGTAAYKNIEEISVPTGGSPGEVLAKLSSSDFDTAWVQQSGGGGGGSGLDPTGVTAGYVPTANGADGWAWAEVEDGVTSVNGQVGTVELTTDDIPETLTKVIMTAAERDKLVNLTPTPSWDDVADKPALGTAAAADVSDFLAPNGVATSDITSGTFSNARIPPVTQLRGFSSGTTPPSGGVDGDIYFQYTV